MSTLTITISIDVPDGVAVKVSGAAPRAPQGAPTPTDEPPWPDMTTAAAEAFPDAVLTPNPPASVLHDTPATPQPPPGGHHGAPWKYVPGGVSKRTGAAYNGFWACQERDCKAKP